MTWTERVKEIRERCEKATPGPWDFHNGHSRSGDPIDILVAEIGQAAETEDPEYGEVLFDAERFGESQLAHNWDFCRHARTDLPAALDRISELEAEVAALREDRERQRISPDEKLDEALNKIYAKYGTNLGAFFADVYASKAKERGGV